MKTPFVKQIFLLFIFAVTFDNSIVLANESYDINYCRAYEALAFKNENSVVQRWEGEELRVLLVGDKPEVDFTKSMFTKFEELAQRNVVYTDEDIDIGIIYTNNLYKYAFSHGFAQFQGWFSSPDRYLSYLKALADQDGWHLVARKEVSETKESFIFLGVFEVRNLNSDVHLSVDEKYKISSAVTSILFPDTEIGERVKIDDVESNFEPFVNLHHFQLAKIWYDTRIHSGMDKNSAMDLICSK